MIAGKRNGEVLALLVRRGGRPSLNHPEWSRHSKGASPLHTAARLGQVANAEHLLKLGADVRVTDASGQTPLHVAAVHEITGLSVPRRLYILCWSELSRHRLLPAVSPAAGHLTTPTAAGLPGLCENFRPTTSKISPI